MLDLLEAKNRDPENSRFIRIARNSARLMLSLVNDMLDFSMIRNNRFTKKSSYFSLARALEECCDLLRF